MAQQWEIDGPKVLDIGDDSETVSRVKVALVGGRADIMTHDDSPTARLEVTEVHGRPLKVSWDGSILKVSHAENEGIFGGILRRVKGGHHSARIALSVPASAAVSLSTVSAEGLVNGVRNSVHANTVSGTLTLDDIDGDVKANTVSGDVECHALVGDLNGNSVSGAMTVEASRLNNVKLNTVTGDIALDLTHADAKITSNSVSGDVTVRVPAGGGYDVTAHTASGQVVIDGQRISLGANHQGGSLSSGDRSLVVKANAVSGNVVVLHAVAEAAAG